MALRTILILIYILITVALFATFNATAGVWISFFLSALVLFFITAYHLFFEVRFSPFISCFIVFSFLFFIVAPIVQINSFVGLNPMFMQNFPYSANLAIQANAYIIIFNVIFSLSYLAFNKSKYFKNIPKVRKLSIKLRPITIVTLAFVTLIIFFSSLPFLMDEYSRPSWKASTYSVATLLIWKKVFFLVPFAGVILSVKYLKSRRTNLANLAIIATLLIFFLIILLWFKNPFTEKRNALGPIYICILYLFFPKLLNSNVKTLFFMFFSMVLLFPLTAIITHSDESFQVILSNPSILIEQMKGGGIANAFNTLNYDAFANFMVSIEMVQTEGLSLGYQLLSALLFFMPRGIWENKPISSGEVAGNYLMDNYDFNFNNLSNPLVSEGFLNFGLIGVILFAVGFALVLRILSRWLIGSDMLRKIMAFYFAIHLIFLLRGDFTNGFSYYIGTLVGVLVIPKTIELLLNLIFLKKRQWRISHIA